MLQRMFTKDITKEIFFLDKSEISLKIQAVRCNKRFVYVSGQRPQTYYLVLSFMEFTGSAQGDTFY